MTTTLSLRYGRPQVVPDNATAAWGARMIVTQDGDVDFIPDRADATGDTESLFTLLETRCSLPDLKALLRDLLRDGVMQTRQAEDFIVYLDDRIVVHANTNGSAGYCYVTAWIA